MFFKYTFTIVFRSLAKHLCKELSKILEKEFEMTTLGKHGYLKGSKDGIPTSQLKYA